MIVIDGAEGEGGGQVLRTALGLSACTGQPFPIKNIRRGRKKLGLLRQRLTCVRAAAACCGGKAEHGAFLQGNAHDPCADSILFGSGRSCRPWGR